MSIKLLDEVCNIRGKKTIYSKYRIGNKTRIVKMTSIVSDNLPHACGIALLSPLTIPKNPTDEEIALIKGWLIRIPVGLKQGRYGIAWVILGPKTDEKVKNMLIDIGFKLQANLAKDKAIYELDIVEVSRKNIS